VKEGREREKGERSRRGELSGEATGRGKGERDEREE